MDIQRYFVEGDLDGESYEILLRACSDISSFFGIVEYGNSVSGLKDTHIHADVLLPYFFKSEIVFKWPGSVLGAQSKGATRFLYRTNFESINLLLSLTSSLWDWGNSGMPNDLHFLRDDESTVFGSTWCTENAWFELTDKEFLTVNPLLKEHFRLVKDIESNSN